jgi:hypothetical protein
MYYRNTSTKVVFLEHFDSLMGYIRTLESLGGYSKIDYFFFDMSTQEGGRGIRTSDLRFIRRGPQLIELPLGD